MRVLVQWATATVADWVEYDITSMSQVRAMPRKPVPGDSPLIDDEPGWAAAINVQGVVLSGDHIGFAINGDGHLVIGQWNDDTADWAAVPFGRVFTFGPIVPDPNLPADPAYRLLNPDKVGQIGDSWFLLNTQQTATSYADDATLQALLAGGDDPWAQQWLDDPNRLPWSEFPKFTSNNQLHGVWLDDALNGEHVAARTKHGWREWGA